MEIVDSIWLGYTEKVFWKPMMFAGFKLAKEWADKAPPNYGKILLKKYVLTEATK
jgi:hypothetical protein